MTTCPYCNQPAALVTSAVIYQHRADLHHKMFWQCKPCKAFVGCHDKGVGHGDGTKPLGRLANAELVRCDSIYLLPGWEKSKGATLEHHIAERLGMAVMTEMVAA